MSCALGISSNSCCLSIWNAEVLFEGYLDHSSILRRDLLAHDSSLQVLVLVSLFPFEAAQSNKFRTCGLACSYRTYRACDRSYVCWDQGSLRNQLYQLATPNKEVHTAIACSAVKERPRSVLALPGFFCRDRSRKDELRLRASMLYFRRAILENLQSLNLMNRILSSDPFYGDA